MVAISSTNEMWYGVEVEGRLRGLPTLFIKGDFPKTIIGNCAFAKGVKHLFFGAGHQSKINFNTVRFFMKKGYLITIDVTRLETVPIDVRKKVHIMFTVPNSPIDILKDSDTIKLEGKRYVYCACKRHFFKNSYKEYEKDEKI